MARSTRVVRQVVFVEAGILERVEKVLHDPFLDRRAYGALSRLVNNLLKAWVELELKRIAQTEVSFPAAATAVATGEKR